MSHVRAALDRVREAGDLQADETSTDFDRYERDYETILGVVDDYGGQVLVDEVAEWVVTVTAEQTQFPSPDAVRDQARTISMEHGIIVPAHTPLRD